MKDYKTLFSDHSETWQDAINRYIAFTNADMKDYFSVPVSYFFKNNEAYTFHKEESYTEDYIAKFVNERNHHIPSDLVDLLSKNGCFKIGRGIFEIFPQEIGFLNLNEALSRYNLSKIEDQISSNMLESLNQYYFFFGVTFPQTDEISFLYFDKAGHLGKMYIHLDNIDLTIKKTLPAMFRGKVDNYTLDSLIAMQIDRVITNALIVKNFISIN